MGHVVRTAIRALSILTGPALLCTGAATSAKAPGDLIPDRYICVFKPGPISPGLEARTILPRVGGQLRHVYTHVLHGFSASMSATAVSNLLTKNPLLDYCEQDRVVSLPEPTGSAVITARPGGGGGGGSTQSTPWGVSRVGGPGNGVGKFAWVIDSGIDLTHPDLTVDVADSKSFLASDPSANDANGHGTHVAGIIAAKNNNIGVVGVAAGATVVSVRVLDSSGNGDDSGVIAGIDYAVAQAQSLGHQHDAINLSLITASMASMDAAVAAAGAAGFYVTIGAGNYSDNAGNYSPAEADGANVYTVSATDSKDTFARYSNYGNPPIDYAEPGSSILSTYRGGTYATLSGTSMAAPHLAGILLLNNGVVHTNGKTALRDPDNNPDLIGIR